MADYHQEDSPIKSTEEFSSNSEQLELPCDLEI